MNIKEISWAKLSIKMLRAIVFAFVIAVGFTMLSPIVVMIVTKNNYTFSPETARHVFQVTFLLSLLYFVVKEIVRTVRRKDRPVLPPE